MKKIDMYKKTPENFHNRINETLDGLGNKKVIKYSFRKYVVACAVVLVLCPVLCVGAGKVFEWYQTAGERFGTEKELEDKLTIEGAVLLGNDSSLESGIDVFAMQSVKKSDGYYFLAGFKWPEGVEWNEDIVIEKSSIISENETIECAANFTGAPDEKGRVYIEVEVNGEQITQTGGEIQLVLENIAQVDKGSLTDVMVEATWELGFSLPTSVEVVSYETRQKLLVNGHELAVDRIEVGNFGVKIYADKEDAMHATYYSTMWLSEVCYKDGTVEKQIETPLRKLIANESDGSFYFNIPLENIVDIDKVTALVFAEGDKSVKLSLGESQLVETIIMETEVTNSLKQLSGISDASQFQSICKNQQYEVLSDDQNVYLWDEKCDNATVIMKLKDYGYDKLNGGEIVAQPGSGGRTILMKPWSDSEKVYLWKFEYNEILENEAKDVWPEE